MKFFDSQESPRSRTIFDLNDNNLKKAMNHLFNQRNFESSITIDDIEKLSTKLDKCVDFISDNIKHASGIIFGLEKFEPQEKRLVVSELTYYLKQYSEFISLIPKENANFEKIATLLKHIENCKESLKEAHYTAASSAITRRIT